jgi:hypothetical protein
MSRLTLPPFRPITRRTDLPAHDTQFLPDGANLVISSELDRLLTLAPSQLGRRRIVLIDGEGGCGKTTALSALAAASSVPVVRAVVTPGATGVKVMEAVHTALTGIDAGLSQRQYENTLKKLLTTEPRLLFIDEAQNAGLPVLQTLRLMLEGVGAQFAFVLSGYKVHEHVRKESQLRGWIGHVATFAPLTPQGTLIPTLTQLHPAFTGVSPHLLVEVDRVYCRGRLREWAVVLETCMDLDPAGQLTKALFTDALDLITHTRYAL